MPEHGVIESNNVAISVRIQYEYVPPNPSRKRDIFCSTPSLPCHVITTLALTDLSKPSLVCAYFDVWK